MLKLFEYHVPTPEGWAPVTTFLEQIIQPGMQVGFTGPLGAGKSFLIKELLGRWGFRGDVPSPTFVLCIQYAATRFTVEHWDLYRLKGLPIECSEPPAPGVVRCIEWPERGGCELSLDVEVRIAHNDPTDPARGRLVEVYGQPISVDSVT